MINIDRYAYCSRLTKVNPMEKFIFSITTMAICIASNSIIISVLILLIMSGVTVIKGGTPLLFYIKLMMVPSGFLVLGVVTVIVNITRNTESMLWWVEVFGTNIGISSEGLETAVNLFFKALGSVSCLYFLSLSTTMIDIISVLRKIKTPEILVELMSLIYRFIFVLMETANKIHTSQVSRLGYSSLSSGYYSLGQLVSVLFIRSYKHSQELFAALESRCYNGKLQVLEEKYAISKTNIFIIGLTNTLLISAAILVGGKF